MSKRLKKHAGVLHFLAKCDKNSARSIIKTANPELIKCFSEICYNILRGGVKLSVSDKKKLSRYKAYIRKLAGRRASTKTKKQIIQKGGFLGLLLRPILKGVIAPLAKSLIE